MVINKLGVIGAGLMGNGIAHVASLSGISVVLMDVQQQALDRALVTMAKNMDRQVSKGRRKARPLPRLQAQINN
jgi:3-hydroxybutyryl-CoA dehydrogenase